MSEIKFRWPEDSNEAHNNRGDRPPEKDGGITMEDLPLLGLAALQFNR